ncbi:Ribonucleases P/MRP protein subunit pop1 [Coemansia pectinata]|uniref:Ribonucleases P/MRP protein subunit pop1 n=1 Tax=Coemansia pectinata TaxID=1052879 RepID=A0A9W8LA36_9FUNG|nr:Ribonucleases P/MRP protein subunit pop1 [Coemansia pectinata]
MSTESGKRAEADKRKARQTTSGFKQHVSEQKAVVPGHATLGKARSLDVTGFVEARSFEINALQRSLENAKTSGNARAFQTLPRHLRRRAASHNVKRMPVRLREKAISEMKKSAASSKTLGDSGRLTNAKKNNRYKRRRTRSVRAEYEQRQTGKRWLETHVWHAKRMHMKEMWGVMVADSPNERSHRAAYRAAMEKTFVQDVSFYRTVEVSGQAEAIIRLVGCLVAPGDLTIAASCYVNGSRMAPLTMYQAGQYPLAALGPATALWRPAVEGEMRVMWIRVHPCIADMVLSELVNARATIQELPVQQLRINDISSDLVSFELLGSQSTQMLCSILSHSASPKSCGASILQAIQALPSPATLPESVVLALRIHDPRLHFPFKLSAEGAQRLPEQQRQLDEVLLQWPAGAASLSDTGDGGIWDRASCTSDVERRPSEHSLNERRHAQLIPGAKLSPDPSIDVTVPLLLIRTGPEALLGSRVIKTASQIVDNLAHGWTILAPKGWGMSLWMALNFAGARAQGLQERHHIGFEAGLSTFPANWPGTSAYDSWAGSIAADEFGKWSRRPPGKRTNYLQMGVESPFSSPFHKLLGVTNSPAAYPEITANDLQCRIKRLRKINSSKKAAALATTNAGDGDNSDVDMADPDTANELELGASDTTAGIWLVSGERLSAIVSSLLTAPHGIVTLAQWAKPLAEVACGHSCEDSLQLLEHALVRVRLICNGRGVPAKNAPIYMRSGAPSTSPDPVPVGVDPRRPALIGYVMTGSFSLARGCSMAIGACSLRGLFNLWKAGLNSQASLGSNKSARVTINSMNGGPYIDAILNVIP